MEILAHKLADFSNADKNEFLFTKFVRNDRKKIEISRTTFATRYFS